MALNAVLRGKGAISKKFSEDKQLESCVHQELQRFAFLMDTKLRLLLLAGKDIASGGLSSMGRKTDFNNSSSPPLVGQVAQDPNANADD